MSISRTSQMPKEPCLALVSSKNCIKRAILKLVAGRESGAYEKYVSISRTSQMPKEPCLTLFSSKNCIKRAILKLVAGRESGAYEKYV
ncbi:MAG: hypothetical protein IKV12_06595, partial [Alistipes sp.]|nr:hypothetical protein [Alistipes sp.]